MRRIQTDKGYSLIIVIMFLALAGLAIATSLQVEKSSIRTVHTTQIRSQEFGQAEQAVARAVSWLRVNSQQLVYPFRKENFYNSFDRSTPSIGDNDTSVYNVPTKVKATGTDDSLILISNPELGSGLFVTTRDITTNVLFDAQSEFASNDFGDIMIRITLVDAIADDPASDFGPLPNPAPETDFYPVYRVDAMISPTEGAHVFATVKGDVAHLFDYGIYGQDFLEVRQPCDSFISSAGPYNNASKRAKCPAASNSTSSIHKNEEIYGSLKTNGDIEADPPFGGETCADFAGGCPNKGETCAGEDCGVPLLDQFDDWNVSCPTNQGDLVITADTTLTVASDDPMDKCWGRVTINNGVTLTLETIDFPYYIHTLHFKNNSNSRLNIQPVTAGEDVEVYTYEIDGDSFNGNQMINANGRPVEFKLYYLGPNDLLLNGNAAMNVAMVAPQAGVTVSGNFEYSGALLARNLLLQGSGGIHYDEDLGGGGAANDVQYRIEETLQHYR